MVTKAPKSLATLLTNSNVGLAGEEELGIIISKNVALEENGDNVEESDTEQYSVDGLGNVTVGVLKIYIAYNEILIRRGKVEEQSKTE